MGPLLVKEPMAGAGALTHEVPFQVGVAPEQSFMVRLAESVAPETRSVHVKV